MVEVADDFIGDYQARLRVLEIFRGKGSPHYFEWNNKKLKIFVKNSQYEKCKTK